MNIKKSDKRFEEYSKLAKSIAKTIYNPIAPFCQLEEVIQWGLIGLWDACTKYSGPEEEFQYYVQFRIKGQIIDEFRKHCGFIRRLGKEDQPKFIDIFDIEFSHEQPSSDNMANARQQLKRILEVISIVLTEKEKYVIDLYCFEGISITEIARKLGLSQPRIFQIKTEAIKKILASVNFDEII